MSQRVSVNGIEIAYEEHGSGATVRAAAQLHRPRRGAARASRNWRRRATSSCPICADGESPTPAR
jgi:hypothetical protein